MPVVIVVEVNCDVCPWSIVPRLAEAVGGDRRSPMAMFVPVRAETGISPHIVEPEIVIPVALTHALASKYCIVRSEELVVVVMHTWAVPSLSPTMFTS